MPTPDQSKVIVDENYWTGDRGKLRSRKDETDPYYLRDTYVCEHITRGETLTKL